MHALFWRARLSILYEFHSSNLCVGKCFESYKGFCLQEAERRTSLNASKANYHKGVAVPRNFQSIYIFIALASPFFLRNSTIRLRPPPLSGITLKYFQWQSSSISSLLTRRHVQNVDIITWQARQSARGPSQVELRENYVAKVFPSLCNFNWR